MQIQFHCQNGTFLEDETNAIFKQRLTKAKIEVGHRVWDSRVCGLPNSEKI